MRRIVERSSHGRKSGGKHGGSGGARKKHLPGYVAGTPDTGIWFLCDLKRQIMGVDLTAPLRIRSVQLS